LNGFGGEVKCTVFSAFTGESVIPSSYPYGMEVSFSVSFYVSSSGLAFTHWFLKAFPAKTIQ
jgi:hypothetical protein